MRTEVLAARERTQRITAQPSGSLCLVRIAYMALLSLSTNLVACTGSSEPDGTTDGTFEYTVTTTETRTYRGSEADFHPYQCGETSKCLYITVGDRIQFFQFQEGGRDLPPPGTYPVGYAAISDGSGTMSVAMRHIVPSNDFALVGSGTITIESIDAGRMLGSFEIRIIHDRTRELLATVSGRFEGPRTDRVRGV